MDSTIKALHKNIAEWMAGPTGAVVLHVLMILALLFLVDFSIPPEDQAIDVKYVEAVTVPFDPPPPALQKPDDVEVDVPTVTPPDVDLTADATPPETPDFSQLLPTTDIPDLAIDLVDSPVILKGLAPVRWRAGWGRKSAIRPPGSMAASGVPMRRRRCFARWSGCA